MCADVDPGLKSIHLAPGPGVDSSPSPDAGPSAPPRQHRSHRSGGARDDRYRSGITNALTLALTLTITITLGSHQQGHFPLPSWNKNFYPRFLVARVSLYGSTINK